PRTRPPTARPAPRRRRRTRRSRPQAREQIVLRQRGDGVVAAPYEALAAEGGCGDVLGDLAEPRLAADLAAVCEQGLALAGEDGPDVDGGGDALLRGERPPLPFRIRLLPVRYVGAGFAQGRPDLPPVAAAHRGEVELGHAAAGGKGLLGRTARVHVVRMLVRTLIVVRDQHLRPVPVDQLRDPARYVRLRDVTEGVRPALVVPITHAGIVVAQDF